MILVYVAGPYSSDPVRGVQRAVDAAERLVRIGFTPIVPHLTMMWHLISPHPIDYWYSLDLQVLSRCDALLRLSGPSTGADKEVAFADEHDIAVFEDIEALTRWASV